MYAPGPGISWPAVLISLQLGTLEINVVVLPVALNYFDAALPAEL